jgi:hypothetical protein
MRRVILVALALASCAPMQTVPVAPAPAEAPMPEAAAPAVMIVPLHVPHRLRACPDAPTEPAAPRTIEQVAAWAGELDDAYGECAARLRRLVDLIKKGTAP